MFTAASSVTQDFLEKTGLTSKDKLKTSMRYSMVVLMVLGISMALILRDIVDATFFFVSLTMSLGFLVLVMWINPEVNRHSVNFSIFLCLIGVVVPAIIFWISNCLVIWAFGFCIAGLIFGFVVNLFLPARELPVAD